MRESTDFLIKFFERSKTSFLILETRSSSLKIRTSIPEYFENRGSRFEFRGEIDILPVTVTNFRFFLVTFVSLPSGQGGELQERDEGRQETQMRSFGS